MANVSHNSLESQEDSLALQMARRMVLLRDQRPLPSLGYQLSSRMVRQKQTLENNKKFQKASGRPVSKKLRAPQES